MVLYDGKGHDSRGVGSWDFVVGRPFLDVQVFTSFWYFCKYSHLLTTCMNFERSWDEGGFIFNFHIIFNLSGPF